MNHAQVALEEAKFWAEELQKAEFRGLGDTREAARYRVASKTGIAESYLKRLRYKWREMGEVAGSQYRALMLAYDELCQSIEAKAEEYERRASNPQDNSDADLESAAPSSKGVVGAAAREEA